MEVCHDSAVQRSAPAVRARAPPPPASAPDGGVTWLSTKIAPCWGTSSPRGSRRSASRGRGARCPDVRGHRARTAVGAHARRVPDLQGGGAAVTVNERPRAEILDAPHMRDNRLFIAETTDYPISGDKIAVFLDDPGHGRVRRMELGDLLWPRVRGE